MLRSAADVTDYPTCIPWGGPSSQWVRPYTGEWDGSNDTKDHFERVTLALRQAYRRQGAPCSCPWATCCSSRTGG